MPLIELGLQAVALGQQRAVLRGEVVHERVEPRPEGGAVDAGARQGFVFDKLVEIRGYLQSASLGHLSHGLLHLFGLGRCGVTGLLLRLLRLLHYRLLRFGRSRLPGCGFKLNR